MAELLRELHAPLLEVSPTPPIRVLALGDCLLNEVRVFLGAECRRAGLAADDAQSLFQRRHGPRPRCQ